MRTFFLLALVAVSLTLLMSCGPEANKQLVLEIGGPCDECPAQRIDSLLEHLNGIAEVNYEPKTGVLNVGIDSNQIKAQQVIDVLLENGYNVSMGSDIQVAMQFNFYCCRADDAEAMLIPDEDLGEDAELLDELGRDFAAEEELNIEDELDKQLDGMLNDRAFSQELEDELLVDESDLDIQIDDSELEGRRRQQK
jgi:copper chaperone CopZ